MKNIKYLVLMVMAFMMVQTSFADGSKTYKGVKVTDKNGVATTFFHVDSIYVYNDTVTVWNYAQGISDGKDVTVAYEVNYYKPQEIEVYDKPRGLYIWAGADKVTSINLNLGQKNGLFLSDNKYAWCSTYAMPYSKKLVATDANGKKLDVEWTTNKPLIATISPDGTLMGHYPGTAKLTATSPTGETTSIDITTTASSLGDDKKLEVSGFFSSEDYNRYFDHYYATEIGVWNSKKCGDFNTAYKRCNVDLNTGLGSGTPDINLGIKFDTNYNPVDNAYITNVIAVYSKEAVDVNKIFKIGDCEYHYASCIGGTNDCHATDINNGVGNGSTYIYLAYTTDGYLRPGETEQRYLVSHSAMAFYGGSYSHDKHLSKYVNDNKNFTRLIWGSKSKVKNDIATYKEKMLNLGSDDEAVMAYTYDPDTETYSSAATAAFVDFQHGAEEEKWMTLVCTYEPYCPPANRWMGELDDNTPVSSLSIPGTHDSATNKITPKNAEGVAIAAEAGSAIITVAGAALTVMCPWIGIPVAVLGALGQTAGIGAMVVSEENLYLGRTQRFGFRDQFRHGVRLFDIRVDASSSKGKLCHGDDWFAKAITSYTYKEMLEELNNCLIENPGEFIILEVKPDEYDGSDYTPAQIWNDTYKIVGKDRLITYKKGLTLKECRGKFLMVGNNSDYVTFNSSGDLDYYEMHRSKSANAKIKGYVGDKTGKIASPLWLNDWFSLGNINDADMREPSGDPAIKYRRTIHQLFNYSKLPIDRDTWLKNNISGYMVGKKDASGAEYIKSGKFDSQLASYLNSRIAHYIKGMNGRPCGIVRMDFAGTNYADQDNCATGSNHIATTYGYYLCQTVIRNNIIGKVRAADGRFCLANGYATPKPAVPTRGSGPVDKICKERSECGWVQLWEDGPKFAEFNVGSSIGTYMGMTQYNDSTVGGHYKYPVWEEKYDRYSDNASSKWGVDWRTPTPDEIQTLLSSEKTSVEYIDGETKKYAAGCTLKGYKISGVGSYAENSIFLPAAGISDGDGNIADSGANGLYWGRNAKNDIKYAGQTKKQTGTDPDVSMVESPSYAEQALSLRPVYEKGKGHPKFRDNRLEEGYYEIDNAEDLSAFSAFVNGEIYNGEQYSPHPTAKGKLTQDIDMSEYGNEAGKKEWRSIGSFRNPFKGKFDGQNHRIKNLHADAPFNAVGSQDGNNICTIENVIVDSSCVIVGWYYIGGLVNNIVLPYGETYTTVKIQNCGNEAEVHNPNDHKGSTAGILGAALYFPEKNVYDKLELDFLPDHFDIRITNCYNTGKIYGPEREGSYYAGIMGLASGYIDMYNCWNTGEVQRNKKNGSDIQIWAPWVGNGEDGKPTSKVAIKNCYSQSPSNEPEGGNGLVAVNETSETVNLKSGELCYQLNKNYIQFTDGRKAIAKLDTIVWHQRIGAEHPTLYSEGSDTVYCHNVKHCDDSESYVYRNVTSVYESDIHSYDNNGFCRRVATHFLPAPKADDYYLIYNAGNLYWFAQEYNAGRITSSPEIMLMTNIVDNQNVFVNGQLTNRPDTLRNWTPIGTNEKPFSGTIRGNGCVVSGLYCKNDGYAGLFGNTQSITMEYVGVIDSYFEANKTEYPCYAGALAGYTNRPWSVKGCYSTGLVRTASADNSSDCYVGGLVGYSTGTSKYGFSACYSTAKVEGVKGEGKEPAPNAYAKAHPLLGSVSGASLTHCYHNNSKYSDGYMTDREFEMGVVCDRLNSINDSVFMSQWIGEYKAPFYGRVGNFIVKVISSEWNSITAPFKVRSDEYVQYYKIESLGDNHVSLAPVEVLEANTPGFMRCLSSEPSASNPYAYICNADDGAEVELPEGSWSIKDIYQYEDKKITTISTLKDVNASTICDGTDYQYCYFIKDGNLCYAKLSDVKLPAFTSAFVSKSAPDSLNIQYLIYGDDKNKENKSINNIILTPETGERIAAE